MQFGRRGRPGRIAVAGHDRARLGDVSGDGEFQPEPGIVSRQSRMMSSWIASTDSQSTGIADRTRSLVLAVRDNAASGYFTFELTGPRYICSTIVFCDPALKTWAMNK